MKDSVVDFVKTGWRYEPPRWNKGEGYWAFVWRSTKIKFRAMAWLVLFLLVAMIPVSFIAAVVN